MNFIQKGVVVLRYAMLLRDFEPKRNCSSGTKTGGGGLVPVGGIMKKENWKGLAPRRKFPEKL